MGGGGGGGCCCCCCCCCCCSNASSTFQPHFSFNSVCMKPTRQPVSLRILSRRCKTSSCSRRSTRHSAAIASERRATLATPLETSQTHHPKRPEPNRPVFDMSNDSTELMRVEQLHFIHLGRARRQQRVRLCKQADSRMIKKTCDHGGPLDKPVTISLGSNENTSTQSHTKLPEMPTSNWSDTN